MTNKIYRDSKDKNHTMYTEQDFMGYWLAYTDNYDCAPDAGPQLVGEGVTTSEALNDLIEQIEDSHHTCT